MKKIIQAVKGTRDFYPEQMALRTWLYATMREVSESFGYQEYEAPILETLELYAAKSGEELVKEQSYVFKDRGGSEITLRPELTPSLARMIAQRQGELAFPVRWWSFGPFWRYEQPQKGRTREFFQWNVDLLGSTSPEADAECVAVLATFFQKVGLKPEQVLILVNSRALMDSSFERLGIPAARRTAVAGWIDRRAKQQANEREVTAREIGLSQKQLEGVEAILGEEELWKQSPDLVRFFAAIDALGLRQYVRFEPSIVRGLAYYTGTVFEAWEVGGEIKRSVLGGGRYDNLLAEVGGDPLPAVGFAMGDVVIGLMLQKYSLLPEHLTASPAAVLVTVFDQERLAESFGLAADLRRAGINVLVYPEPVKLQKQLRYADKIGARLAVIIGPDEAESNHVLIKDLSTGSQDTVEREIAADAVKRSLGK